MGVPASQQKLLDGVEENVGMFMKKSLEYAMTELPLSENYHWRVYFMGSYTREICPEYLKEPVFNKLKSGLVNNISIHTCTITEFLKEYPHKDITKFVLLDHMVWLTQPLHNNGSKPNDFFLQQDWMSDKPQLLAEEWQEIINHAAPNARIIWRSAAKETDFVFNTVVNYKGEKTKVIDLMTLNRELAEKLHKQDRVHTYTSFYIADLKV